KIAKAASETFQPSRGRSAPAVGADPHRQAGADMPPISRDKGIQGNKTRPAVEPPIEERIDDVDDMETILATKEPVESPQEVCRRELVACALEDRRVLDHWRALFGEIEDPKQLKIYAARIAAAEKGILQSPNNKHTPPA